MIIIQKGICLKFVVALTAVALATSSLSAQEFAADTTGLWGDASNWSGGAVPTGFARVAGGGANNTVVTIDDTQLLAGTGGRFIFGQGGTGGSVTIVSGGSLTTQGTTVHRLGQTSAFTTTIEAGGTLNVQNAGTSTAAGSSVIVNGGNLDFLSFQQLDATVQINGSLATFDVVNNYTTTADSILEFNLDAAGISSIDVGGQLGINSGADLLVDASGYSPGPTTVSLATYGSLTNANEFTENVIAPAGYDVDVVYGTTSLDLVFTAAIPEPSSAAIVSLLGLVALRRRRN